MDALKSKEKGIFNHIYFLRCFSYHISADPLKLDIKRPRLDGVDMDTDVQIDDSLYRSEINRKINKDCFDMMKRANVGKF